MRCALAGLLILLLAAVAGAESPPPAGARPTPPPSELERSNYMKALISYTDKV